MLTRASIEYGEYAITECRCHVFGQRRANITEGVCAWCGEREVEPFQQTTKDWVSREYAQLHLVKPAGNEI
jgi:hypothetical protein